jgi:hypothetical protein
MILNIKGEGEGERKKVHRIDRINISKDMIFIVVIIR